MLPVKCQHQSSTKNVRATSVSFLLIHQVDYSGESFLMTTLLEAQLPKGFYVVCRNQSRDMVRQLALSYVHCMYSETFMWDS